MKPDPYPAFSKATAFSSSAAAVYIARDLWDVSMSSSLLTPLYP
jgi:hypothetical protein